MRMRHSPRRVTRDPATINASGDAGHTDRFGPRRALGAIAQENDVTARKVVWGAMAGIVFGAPVIEHRRDPVLAHIDPAAPDDDTGDIVLAGSRLAAVTTSASTVYRIGFITFGATRTP